MKILHTVPSFGKESYGLGSISLGMVKSLLDLGQDVYLWSGDKLEDVEWAANTYNIPIERLHGFSASLPPFNMSLQELILSRKMNFDVVHQHSLWTFQSIVTSYLVRNGTNSCVASHGTLSQFALKKSKFKKELALLLFERRNLENAKVLHATSENEIEDYKRLNFKNPIAYIENGIGSQFINKKGCGIFFKEKYNIPTNKKVLLYLSRITPKKGLDMLLQAISEIKSKFQDWILVVVGNDEFNYLSKVQEMILNFNLDNSVFIIEPQIGDAKFDAFDASDFFILPSYSEGSPMVVVEALAFGLPVITTKSSSWSDLNDSESGFWVDIDKDAIKNSISKMCNLKDGELNKYSENAKKLVREKYLWNEISKKNISLYNWMVYNDLKPNFVY